MLFHICRGWLRYLTIPIFALLGLIALLLAMALVTVFFARVGDAKPSFFGRTTGEPSRIVVLVHGTFAPNADWTEPGSTLVRAIRAAEPADNTLFVRFNWPGSIGGYQNNTNFVRYGAGQKLGELLWQLRKQHPRARIVVIAHSHGGNVALYAARHAPHLAGMVLMGTPFISVSPRDLTGDLALSTSVSLLVFVLFLLLEILSGLAGLVALVAGASTVAKRGVAPKLLGGVLVFIGLGLCFWMVEPDGTEQVWVPGTYTSPGGSPGAVTSSGHYETRTKWKQSKQADALEAAFKASAFGYVERASREGGADFAQRMTASIPQGTPALCLVASPPDEAMAALGGALPVTAAPSTILNSAEAAESIVVLAVGLVLVVGLVAGVSAARAARTPGVGEGRAKLLPAVAGGIVIGFYTSMMAALAASLVLPFLALISVVLRVPAAVPYMVSFGSLDVIASLASTTTAHFTPSRGTPEDGVCEVRRYIFPKPAGLRHSEYYLDRQSTRDLATWTAQQS